MKNLNSMNIKGLFKAAGIVVIGITMTACQGQLSEKPPIHPNMNMDQQPRKEAQEVNNFFEDGRSMRQPVAGTVARGLNKTNTEYYAGENENGDWVEEMPIAMTRDLIYRGKERYEIFCTPCHGKTGDGRGIIMTGQYGYVPAPSYHIDRLRDASDGELYSAIYNGVRSMPSYATQVKVEDRWAIVAYIRALQASQNVQEVEMQEFDVDIAALQNEFAAEQARQDSLLAARTPEETPEASVELGMNVVQMNGCAACHNVSGEAGGIGPTWAGLYGSESQGVNEAGETITIVKDEDYIYESIVMPNAKKTEGYEQGVMAPYGYLPEHELQSLVLYIKSLSDN